MTLSALVIHNPTAGQKKDGILAKAIPLLAAAGVNVFVHETKTAGDATIITRKILTKKEAPNMIIAVGGDGTISEVAKGFPANTKTVLGVLPAGTANVLSFEQKIPRKAKGAVAVLLTGRVKKICMPRLNGERFSLMVGVGYDSLAVNAVSKELKQKIGPLAYIAAAIKAAKRFKEMNFTVTIDGVARRANSVIVTNAKKYGGPFTLVAKAEMSEPCLHVVLMGNAGLWAAIRYGVALALGRIDNLSDVEIVRGMDIHIEGPAGFPVQADGDDVCTLPVHIKMGSETVPMLVPS